jgi:hypothetical protein
VIGAAGGTLALPDGSAQVTFLPNAVTQNTTVQIARTTPPAQPTNGQQLVSTMVNLRRARRYRPRWTDVQLRRHLAHGHSSAIAYADRRWLRWPDQPAV